MIPNQMFCIFCLKLQVLADTVDKLSHRLAVDTHGHTHTHRGNGNTLRPNWPRVKKNIKKYDFFFALPTLNLIL